MAALVQSFPQQSATITMLQPRPASASGPFHGQMPRNAQASRNMYNAGTVPNTYRGVPPVAPYAFTATPVLGHVANPLRQNPTGSHLRLENRTASAPVVSLTQPAASTVSQTRQRQLATSPTVVLPNSAEPMGRDRLATKDDFFIPRPRPNPSLAPRPLSAMELGMPDSKIMAAGGIKPSPDRYRRNQRRVELGTMGPGSGPASPSGSGMAPVGPLYSHPAQSVSSPSFLQQSYRAPLVDGEDEGDAAAPNQPPEEAKRYRRRSSTSPNERELAGPAIQPKAPAAPSPPVKTWASVVSSPYVAGRQDPRPFGPARPGSSHERTGSNESVSSNRSHPRPSSAKRETGGSALPGTAAAKQEANLVAVPPRGSSDANKRFISPSPLSKPMASSPQPPTSKSPLGNVSHGNDPPSRPTAVSPPATVPESPAAQHLAALNKTQGKKEGKSSRLRRAFSFGSAAELRKASAENSRNHNNDAAERTRLRKEQYRDENEAHEAAIVQRQEAGGLGQDIYSGQGHFFTGSTDNLSVSSTASSASIMLRKMGKGVKRSTRSLVGLFRPKSVVGVPAADPDLPAPSRAQVSMVTVEAEREMVNVEADPHDHVGGGTDHPKLGRDSVDAASVSDRSSDIRSRRSISGGEKERAEVLAAVKKGILKRNGTDSGNSSPVHRPIDSRATDFVLPQLPRFGDSPMSSAPSTPTDDHVRGHRRTDSVTVEGEDYFMSAARFGQGESRSLPGTPRSGASRNISFSPQIRFHDTWPSGEYDRRGEIATCNRLTPMLAQQIKEELNTFKMEMEVHESSKVYTHFF